jgi:8-oxo-dGTP diphosphatase
VILSSLLYLRRAGHTLMLHKARGDQRGKWNGLGGKFEAGETPQTCARREAYEESGLRVGRVELRGVLTFPLFDGRNDWIVFVFTSNDFSGDLHASDEGELAWIEDERLEGLELYEGDRVFLPWLDGERGVFSGRFEYGKGGEFLGYEVEFYEGG